MNWGWKIVLIFAAFIGLMFYFFTRALTVEDNMVRPDYYQEEYQINQIREWKSNYFKLGEEISVEYNKNESLLRISGPLKMDSGSVWVFRPSDSRMDQKLKISSPSEEPLTFKVHSLKKGYWKVILNWSLNGKGFQAEKSFQIRE